MTSPLASSRFILCTLALAALAACGGGSDDSAAPAAVGTDAEPSAVAMPDIAAPSPDLAFAPAAVDLPAGGSASVHVALATGADLHGARFDLPGAQRGVVGSFEADADGHGGTLTLSASAAVASAEKDLSVAGASAIDNTKAWVGALRIKTIAVTAAKTLFVDPVGGQDTSDGSQAAPLRTLGKAVTLAASGDTIHLAAGQFTPLGNGDKFPITVPSGITIEGTLNASGGKATVLSPQTSAEQATGLVLAGDATIKHLEMDVFGTAIQAGAGVQSLDNLDLILNHDGVSVFGKAKATLSNSEVFVGLGANLFAATAGGQSSLTLDNTNAETSSQSCMTTTVGVLANQSASLTMRGARFHNFAGQSVFLAGAATGVLGLHIDRQLPAGCQPLAAIESQGPSLAITTASSIYTSGGVNAIGIYKRNGGTLSVDGTEMHGDESENSHFSHSTNIYLEEQSALVLTRSFLRESEVAVDATLNERTVTVADSNFDLNRIAIWTTRGLKVRRSQFRDFNAVSFFGGSLDADLGTLADPGNNSFLRPLGTYDQSQVAELFFPNGSSGTVNAIGNTWNFATQGADIFGHYNKRTTLTGPTAKSIRALNFVFISSTPRVQL